MLAAIAEFEHDLIVERTKDGLAAARARGRKGGGRSKMTATKARQARAMYDEKTYTVQQIAETFAVSRGTIYRHLGEDVSPALVVTPDGAENSRDETRTSASTRQRRSLGPDLG